VVGPYLADFLRAGPDFSATTLSRFYALHMMVVPGLMGALVAAHLFLVVKLGTTAPPWVKAARPKGARPTEMVPAGVPAPEPEASLSTNGTATNGAAPETSPVEPADEPVAEVVADEPAAEAAEAAPAEEAPAAETAEEAAAAETEEQPASGDSPESGESDGEVNA
jgi:hypothetical protein